MPIAYSYIRFSTQEQSKGDSQRRQLANSFHYAVEHGLQLDEHLSFADLGKSAFRGRHALDGGLRLFITAIEEGKVQPGSFLLIENLDRLSRQPPVDALRLLQSIVEHGITVVTLTDGRRYTSESLRNDPSSLLISIIMMFRAYEESKMKGERVRQAWVRKKQKDARAGMPITSMTPVWLKVVDGKFEVVAENAAVVRKVFDLATKEGLGQRAITTRLREEGVPAIGRKGVWTESGVRRIITNPAVIGMYQPQSRDTDDPSKRTAEGDAIENYFPEIIDKGQFYDAQRLRNNALIPRGPRGKGVGTIFTGILFCGCGATMQRKGASTNDPMERLRCSRSCGMQSWKYDPLEKAVLTLLSTDLLPHVEIRETDRKKLQVALAEATAKRKNAQTRIGNLVKAIEEGGEVNSLLKALKLAESEETQAGEEVRLADEGMKKLEITKQTAADRHQAVAAMAQAIRTDAGGQTRERLRYALSRTVDRIDLLDTDEQRIARVTVGATLAYIDFSRSDKTFSLRGEEFVSQVFTKAKGEKKPVIP